MQIFGVNAVFRLKLVLMLVYNYKWIVFGSKEEEQLPALEDIGQQLQELTGRYQLRLFNQFKSSS